MNHAAEPNQPYPLHPSELSAIASRAAGRSGSSKKRKNPHAAVRFRELNSFIDLTMAGLTRAEIATWLAMFRYVDAKKQTVTISIETISRGSGTSVRHVHRAIGSLLAKGLVKRLKVGGLNDGASVYRLRSTMHP